MEGGGGGEPSLTGIWTLDRLNKFYQGLLYHLSYVGLKLHFLPKCDGEMYCLICWLNIFTYKNINTFLILIKSEKKFQGTQQQTIVQPRQTRFSNSYF